jgi:hypothetical protein
VKIRHILYKDWTLLWPMVALVTIIQIGFEWAVHSTGLFQDNPASIALLRPLTLAWYAGLAAMAAAVVHQDTIPGADQDWLIRPVERSDLLLAKIVFAVIVIVAPMLVLNVAHALVLGFPFVASLRAAVYKEAFVCAIIIIPVLAFASTTRNMAELTVFGAALMVVYAVSAGLSAFLLGADWCPTCDTGVSWLEHWFRHAGTFAGALVVLALQYHRRRTAIARTVVVMGAVVLASVQLPWNAAFAIQRWLDGAAQAGTAIELALESPVVAEASGAAPDARAGARQATQALLHGDVGRAGEYLRRRAVPGRTLATLDLSLRVTGTSPGEVLLLDRTEARFFSGEGRLLYRGLNPGGSAGVIFGYRTDPAAAPELVHQKVDVPGRTSLQHPARLQLDYSLTRVQVVAEQRLRGLGRAFRSADGGLCAAKLDQDEVFVRCKSVEQSPFCFSATVYAADGRHNPEILKCTPDYRRNMPPPTEILHYYGIDLPVHDRFGLAHYAVGPADLQDATVLLKFYGQPLHFKRTLVVSPLPEAT